MKRVFSTEKKALRRTGPEVRVYVPYLRNGLEPSGAGVELPRGQIEEIRTQRGGEVVGVCPGGSSEV